ncbi:MAG: helix-turn-helix transcriptional regulator [Oscillospiraceae bacterium]|nr:helix-turn-helix transcriptional regulator [Oscillospiraceae bacterium]
MDFMTHNFVIGEITFANAVKAGTFKKEHKNRKNHGLAIFPGGEWIFDFGDKKLKVTGNTIVYFPRGCDYTIREKVPFDCYAINFQMPDGASFEPFAFKVKNMNTYLESFRQAQRHQTRKDPGYVAKIKAELYHIIYNMQSEHSLPYATATVIEPALAYIHKNYDKENISVSFLAQLCGISTVHLRNTFLKRFAMSPVRYINDLKLTRARELLGSQFYTVNQVCFLSGYRDESHFCREFKKHFGVTPGDYMKTAGN